MSANPYVDSKQIIDTEANKPYELLHERAFVNVSVATGWQVSDDGLYNYYKEITLPVSEDEFPITLEYRPFVVIPQNVVNSCKPSNFPYARTVAQNKIRLYAYTIPDAQSMLPVTITMKAVGDPEGSTNGIGVGDSTSGIVIEPTVLQVRGTTFLVPTDSNNVTTESVKIEIYISAYKGDEQRNVTFGDISPNAILFNMDGTAINIDDNNIIIETMNSAGDNPLSCVFWATIPAGTVIKDKLAYFVIPVSGDGLNQFVRSTLLTSRSNENVNKIARYEITAPKIERSTGGTYYADGAAVVDGIRFIAKSFTVNGVSADASGTLALYNVTNSSRDLIARIGIPSGSALLTETSLLNGVDNLGIDLEVEGSVVESITTGIATSIQDVTITTSHDYLVPILEESEHTVPRLTISLNLRTTLNFVQDYYGKIKVVSDKGDTIVTTGEEAVKSLLIESRTYDSATLPSSYKIEVRKPETSLSSPADYVKFVSILKQGDAATPIVLDLSPSVIIALSDSSGVIEDPSQYKFTARVLRGTVDISSDWEFDWSVAAGSVTLTKNGLNEFELVNILSSSGVVNITANLIDGAETLTQQITFSKVRQSEGGGNFTFIKYGDRFIDEEGNVSYQFTVDPDGILPDGEVVGLYYGIATTTVDTAPTNPEEYKWFSAQESEPIPGEQGLPGGSFYIDGESIVKAIPSEGGELVLAPQFGAYKLLSLSEVPVLGIKWQYRALGADVWLDFSEDVNQGDEITIDYNLLPFGPTNSSTIRAEITTFSAGESLTLYAMMNIYLIYTNSANFFGQVRTINGPNEYSHTFPIDRFSTAVDGLTYSKNPVYLTTDVYKGPDKLVAVSSGSNIEDTYEIVSVLDNNATLSFDIIDGQPSISYDSIIGESGTTIINIKLPDETVMSLPFNWNTNRVNSELNSYIEAIPSKTEFVIEDASLSDINNWSQDVALSLTDSLQENESIKVYFHVKDTNIERILISNDLGGDFSLATSGLQYTNGTGPKAPITIVNSRDNSFYSGNMVPGNYYLIVSKGYSTTPSMRLFSGKNELEEFEMPDSYSFGESLDSKAMIIKAAAGVDNFIYADDSSFTPYLFKFTPIEEAIDILGQDKYYDGSLLNIDRLAADVPNYLDLIPQSRVVNSSPDFSFEVDENGVGYMLINPLFAINPTYFSNTFANSNTNIRVDTVTGESTTFSIFRKVFPYRELSDLAGDMKIIQNNTYIDAGSINTLKTVADRISIERNRIVELIEEEAVESVEPERTPGRVTANMLYPPQYDEEEGYLYYTIPTEGQTINFNEPRVEGNMIDYRSFVGFNLYDESYYYVSFEVNSESSVTLSFRMMNVLNDSVVGNSSSVTFTGKRKFEFLIPRVAAPESGPEVTVVSNYLLTYFEASDVPAPFNRPLVDHTAENQFSPYYLYMIVDDSKPKPEEVKISNLLARELRYEKKTTSNIYFILVGSTSYVEMNTYINSFLNDVTSLVQLYNTQIEDNGKSNILTEDYLHIWENYSLATEWLEKVLKEMDTTLRKEMQEGVFRTSTTSREHIFGFTNAEEYLSSFSITPGGVLVKGEKNEIIGSTSIGELYGKKIVIGKSITQKDIEYDMEYRKTSGQGFLAVWESDVNSHGQELESGVWSSVLNKQGQFFMRYRPNSTTGKKEMVGYMVMNAEEIAAYNFNSVISEGLSEPAPMDFLGVPKTSIFEINARGQVSINQLVVNDSGNLKGNLDLMNVIRITRFTSSDGERDGIVFIGI